MNYLSVVGPWQWIIIAIAFAIFILPVIALVDILSSEFQGQNKLIWVIVVIFLNVPGIILYYAIGRKQKIRKV